MYIQKSHIDKSENSSKVFDQLLLLNHNNIDPIKFLGFSWISYCIELEIKPSTFIFREEKQELLVVQEGKVKKGSWEILTLSNSLLINDGEQELLFNIVFFGNVGLILKKENVDEYLFLIKRVKSNIQDKPISVILKALMADYTRIQQQFNNINLEPKDASAEFEDISEFHEYRLFPYVATLGSIVLFIIATIIILSNFWDN